MKIIYMAFFGILISLTISCAENSTSTIAEVHNSDISKTTQSQQQPTPQPDTDTLVTAPPAKMKNLLEMKKKSLPIRFKTSFPTIPISLTVSLTQLLDKPVCR